MKKRSNPHRCANQIRGHPPSVWLIVFENEVHWKGPNTEKYHFTNRKIGHIRKWLTQWKCAITSCTELPFPSFALGLMQEPGVYEGAWQASLGPEQQTALAWGPSLFVQSSLNAEDGMGVASLSVIYASIIVSSMFLPPIMIKNLGCKWTIVAGMACYVSYSFGNLYPGW